LLLCDVRSYPARNPIYNYNTPSREFSGLFNGLLKYMGCAYFFALCRRGHESSQWAQGHFLLGSDKLKFIGVS
jgi:hypothetical protein